MKILCVDTFADGHHCAYIKGLSRNEEINYVLVVPEEIKGLPLNVKQIIVPYKKENRNLCQDWNWNRQIRRIAITENPDIVHFLYGDWWYRYFGLNFYMFDKWKLIVTMHAIPEDRKHRISIKSISKIVDTLVVHTNRLLNVLKQNNIYNVEHVEYPCFFPIVKMEQKMVRRELHIPEQSTVFACLGGTRYYKGLDILLSASRDISGDFHLLIAGSEEDFKKDYIKKEIKEYREHVTMILHQLSDEEFIKSIIAADWILLPYRKYFTGASGPLSEGVMYYKKILGTDSGSIGDLIQTHDLGLTFESENPVSLKEKMIEALNAPKEYSGQYEDYRNSLLPETFSNRYKNIYYFLYSGEKSCKKN